MIKFSKEKVLLLHRLIAEETGGSIGVRYETLLESALENVFSGFGGQEFYPTREEKGARLGYALISNHAFVDGNVFCQVKIPGFAKANSLVLPREFPGNCQINSLVLPRYFTRMRALRRR